jgi:hypothetical protein
MCLQLNHILRPQNTRPIPFTVIPELNIPNLTFIRRIISNLLNPRAFTLMQTTTPLARVSFEPRQEDLLILLGDTLIWYDNYSTQTHSFEKIAS